MYACFADTVNHLYHISLGLVKLYKTESPAESDRNVFSFAGIYPYKLTS